MTGMKKLVSMFTLAMIFAGFSAATANGQNIINEILNRMDANNKGLKSLKSDIKMAKYNPQIDVTDLYEGAVQYIPSPSKEEIRIRIDWAKPQTEHLAVGAGKYIMYRPRIKQAIVGKVGNATKGAGAGNALAFMNMNRAQLKANYDVAYLGEESVNGTVRTWHLQLTPKGQSSYESADLWVDKDGMPVQAKVVEKNGDSTTVQLTNIQRNATIDAGVFNIKPPKGTRVVEA